MPSRNEKIAFIAAYAIVFIILGIKPFDRAAWALENSVPFIEGFTLVALGRWWKIELTRLAWWMIALHMIIQMIGGHYTYAEVPLFNDLRDRFGWSRNHYDRLAHFAVGFCLYIPFREIYLRHSPMRGHPRWAGFVSFASISALAGLWEVWEWAIAALAYSDLGAAYLGTQGDVWDAQKDIALAPIGAVAALPFRAWDDRMLATMPPVETQP